MMRNTWIGVLAFILFSSPESHAVPARFALSPDNSRANLVSMFRAARENLLINIYEFESSEIADALISRIRAGVTVELLAEGEPVSGLSDEAVRTLSRIRDAMTASRNPKHRLFVMTDGGSGKRRFRYDHAKYVVADGARALVSSENFTDSGHAAAGKVGNRGWEVVLQDADLAQRLTRLFRGDTDRSHGDIVQIGPRDPIPVKEKDGVDKVALVATSFKVAPLATTPDDTKDRAKERHVPALAAATGDVARSELITSPDSLSALVRLIRSARDTLVLEHMSFPSQWKSETGESFTSPLVVELVEAARRGVAVRVLLNDDAAFAPPTEAEDAPKKKRPNEITARLLRAAGRCERLALAARIVDTKKVEISYIHNKGIVVDGAKVLVSSINGTRNSIEGNREVALLLESRAAGTYYGSAFDFDWKSSSNLPRDPEDPACNELPRPARELVSVLGL